MQCPLTCNIFITEDYLSCCCDVQTSSNFLLQAFREACVNVWILLRLAVSVLVMSAEKVQGKGKYIFLEYWSILNSNK